MAYYDHTAAAYEERKLEKYEELKTFILEKDDYLSNEWNLALEVIRDKETEIKQKDEQLAKYREFFSLLEKLTPKPFSLTDTIF